MESIIYNPNNLNESDINNIVRRAKLLIINSNDEILFANSINNDYFFVGGRVEENETFDECIVREMLEETGIEMPLENRIPFFTITYMTKDYPSKGINRKTVANYYVINCDIKPNLSNTNLTEEEKSWGFGLEYINKDKALEKISESLKICKNKNAVSDTLEALKAFLCLEEL